MLTMWHPLSRPRSLVLGNAISLPGVLQFIHYLKTEKCQYIDFYSVIYHHMDEILWLFSVLGILKYIAIHTFLSTLFNFLAVNMHELLISMNSLLFC
jgi:hypothetical protein